jgi:transposase
MSMDGNSFPTDPDQLRALLLEREEVIAELEQTVLSQQQKVEKLEREIARLLRKQHGPQQERVDPDQLMLFSLEELDQISKEIAAAHDDGCQDSASGQSLPRKRGHGRRKLPAHLPREQRVHKLSEEELPCPCCGELREECGSETSEQLEYTPAVLKVIEHVRKKYACRRCEAEVEIAAKPAQPIAKGLPGPSLLAHTVLSKSGDHLPLYRQEDMLARHGVVIRRSTLCDWIASAAELSRPIWNRMRELVLESRVIHTDDTSVKMLDSSLGHARTCRFWVYIGDPSGPYSVFDFTEDRTRDGPAKFLSKFTGYLQADAYSGYDGIYSGGKVVEVACFAHCRRYWWEARTKDPRRAHEALSYIGRLYALEEEFLSAQLDEESIGQARAAHAVPILTQFKEWLDRERPRVLPKSAIGDAFRYTSNQWDALLRYAMNGVLAIDNSVAERAMKFPALGRKNWIFVASHTGGDRAAILFSLVASCKANQVEPFAYLADLFEQLPLCNSEDGIDHLLPDRWLSHNPDHRWHIDQLREAEREHTRQQKLARRRRRNRARKRS